LEDEMKQKSAQKVGQTAKRSAYAPNHGIESESMASRQIKCGRGRVPTDMSATKGIGYDIESKDPSGGDTLRIEVKGRVVGADHVTLTVNEVRCARNVPNQFRLAIVQVQDDVAREPVYVRGDSYGFGQPGFTQTSSTYPIPSLLQRGSAPA
jgi:hypothetical protein